ncbi:hypothetical protein [Chitinibacter tainanensis]|uniref:hypothetical protein n=1 Tax=Chitinibacter tainanensis TaxID=230667 RepID=UPI00235445B6|nr:hypothetical protein [Chitinibacter tainanensis]
MRIFFATLLLTINCLLALPSVAAEPFTAEQQLELERIKHDVQLTNLQVETLKQNQLAELENQKNWFETSRKSIDWWESHLSVLTGAIGLFLGVFGLLIPFLVDRQRQSKFDAKMAEMEAQKKRLSDLLAGVSGDIDNLNLQVAKAAENAALIDEITHKASELHSLTEQNAQQAWQILQDLAARRHAP